MTGPLLTIKELASALGRSRMYVFAMRQKGFRMKRAKGMAKSERNWVASESRARKWLKYNPQPMAGIWAMYNKPH